MNHRNRWFVELGYAPFMARVRLSSTVIAQHAIAVVDADGLDALSLSAVADRLGVGPSALYTHVDGLDGLRQLVAIAATDLLAQQLRTAAIGTSGDAALAAMGSQYRAFARTHPGRFAATLRPPHSSDDGLDAANAAVVDVFVLVYGAMGLADDASRAAATSTRSAIHGFLALEYVTGSSPDHDDDYAHLLQTLRRGLAQGR